MRAAALLLLVVGCSGESMPAPDVVARIDGREIVHAEFEAYLRENSVDSAASLGSQVLSSLLDQFLDEELLRRLAVERAEAPDDAGRREALLMLIDGSVVEGVTEEEVLRHYRDHEGEYRRPERVRLRQILVEDVETRDRVVAELAAGTPFEEVARRHSSDSGAVVGGWQGELAREDLPLAFAEPIFRLQPGEVSEVVAVDYGFHLFQVTERYPESLVPLAEAKLEIAENLTRQKEAEVQRRLVGDEFKETNGRSATRTRYQPYLSVNQVPPLQG